MNRGFFAVGLGVVLCFAAAGCAAGGDESIGEASQAQIDPQVHDWGLYTITFSDDTAFVQVLAVAKDVGEYDEETEYWYVDTSHLGNLGTKGLQFSFTGGDGDPGRFSGDQEFTLPLHPSWNSFSADPVSGGSRYDSGNMHLRIKAGTTGLTGITWYQSISSGSPANIIPSGSWTVGSGDVSPSSGQTGYYIDATGF